jgi:hypothetical protein
MKNITTDKWDIGWRSTGTSEAPAIDRSDGQDNVASQRPSGGVIVKSITHPQKPKVPAATSSPVRVAPQYKPVAEPVAAMPVEQAKPRVTPAKIQASQNETEPAQSHRDMQSGMELLAVEFIMNLAEKTDFDTRQEAVMHNIGLNELIRRDKLDRLDSKTLAAYATNDGNFYSGQIQCSAMQILAKRTDGK